MGIPDFYATLGVAATANQDDIKKSYRDLAKAYHPDHNPGKEDQFRAIHEAYKVLSDETRRRDYDLSRKFQDRNSRAAMEEYTEIQLEAQGKQLGRVLREVLRQGNMTRVKLKYKGSEVFDLPLNTALLVGGGALALAPILTLVGSIGLSQVFQVSLKNQMMEDYEEATRLHEGADLMGAKKLYLKVIEKSEFFLPAYMQMGQLYRQLGENNSAQEMFNKVLEIMPFGEVADLSREQLRQIRGY